MHVPQSNLWRALCITCSLLASTVSDAEGCSHRQERLESCHAACHAACLTTCLTTSSMSLILLLDRHCCWALSWLGRVHHTWRESCCRPRPLRAFMSLVVWQACAANAAAAQARHGPIPEKLLLPFLQRLPSLQNQRTAAPRALCWHCCRDTQCHRQNNMYQSHLHD